MASSASRPRRQSPCTILITITHEGHAALLHMARHLCRTEEELITNQIAPIFVGGLKKVQVRCHCNQEEPKQTPEP